MKESRKNNPLQPLNYQSLRDQFRQVNELASEVDEYNQLWTDLQSEIGLEAQGEDEATLLFALDGLARHQKEAIAEIEQIVVSGLFEEIAKRGYSSLEYKNDEAWPIPMVVYEANDRRAIAVVADEEYTKPAIVATPVFTPVENSVGQGKELPNASEKLADILESPGPNGYRVPRTVSQLAKVLYGGSSTESSVLKNRTGQLLRNPQLRLELEARGYTLSRVQIEVGKKKLFAYCAEVLRDPENSRPASLDEDSVRAELIAKDILEDVNEIIRNMDRSMRGFKTYPLNFARTRMRDQLANARLIVDHFSTRDELRENSISLKTRLLAAYLGDRQSVFEDEEMRRLTERVVDDLIEERREKKRQSKNK